jgi:site-specific recombinase XerD
MTLTVVDRVDSLPAIIRQSGDAAASRFLEFFAADIRNAHTRRAYVRSCGHFLGWCESHGIRDLAAVTPIVVASYVEWLGMDGQIAGGCGYALPSVKLSLAALRRMFDYLVVGQIVPVNPALSVRGPRFSVTKGRTAPLEPDQVRELFASIDAATTAGLRDRALIAVMAYAFARVGAVVKMRVEDYFQRGKRWHFRLHEKNGKELVMPAHHSAEEHLDAYLSSTGITDQKKGPLFRTLSRSGTLSTHAMSTNDAFRMVRRRALAAGLPASTGNHTFRATSATTYLANGGRLEHAQRMMGHSDPRTTKMYDHTLDKLTLDEVEKITY